MRLFSFGVRRGKRNSAPGAAKGTEQLRTGNSEQIVRIAEIEIYPVDLESYTGLLKEQIETSIRSEAGVLTLYAMSVKDSPHSIHILEVYASQRAYEAHLQAAHFVKYKALTALMVRSFRLIEMDPVFLLAKTSS